ncbi:putative transcriptional regulator [Anaerotaenia torta]|uniref:helix-turn-helix domain-containing protein n=1 Tax=Anaerotaenia torta TaxID=433293 RepID=UPI003D246011
MGTIVYNKLLAMMEQKGLTTYKIRKDKIISEGTLQNIRNGKSITLDSVASLCDVLNCQPGDILDYIPDTDTETRE